MGRHLEKMVAAGLLSLALLTSLTGCLKTTQTPPSSQPSQGGATSQASHTIPPEENRMFSVPNVSWYSSQDGQGFYLPGSRLLSYYDPESQCAFVEMCGIEGYQLNKATVQYIARK